MKLAWLTDIHLNFLNNKERAAFYAETAQQMPDAILITGDIGEGNTLIEYLCEIQAALKLPTYFVLGNHDYYRSSLAISERHAGDVCRNLPEFYYLDQSDVIFLTASTALVGHSSWYDVRAGNYQDTNLSMSDFRLIKEFVGLERSKIYDICRERADLAAAHFQRLVPKAFKQVDHLILATHVPPFAQAVFDRGRDSGADTLPFYTSQVVGETLIKLMQELPSKSMTVLCGHTHSAADMQILPNLRVLVGVAEYGMPCVQRVLEV